MPGRLAIADSLHRLTPEHGLCSRKFPSQFPLHIFLTGSIAVLHGMEVTNGDEVVTVCYKVLNDNIPILLNAYLPSKEACTSTCPPGSEFPAVIYFHGGGLTVGNKESWFPTWLKSPFFLLL